MTVENALDLLWREVKRSSQARIATRIGVSPATVTRWKSGAMPEGENREKLLAWAEGLPKAEPVDVLREAVRQTGENLARLSEIKGMADAVLKMLRSVADQQQAVVDSLAPWSSAEGRVMAAELAAQVPAEDLEQIRESVRRSARATPDKPTKNKKASGER